MNAHPKHAGDQSAVDNALPRGHGKRAHRHARQLAAAQSPRMPRWQLHAVYSTSAALLLSGVIWLLLHYFGRVQAEFGPAPNPFEHGVLAVHGAAAMAFLLVLGSLLPIHLVRGWSLRRNFTSGLLVLGVNTLLIASGYGLYYFSGDALRSVTSLVHWILGLAIAALLVWHVISGRERARR